MSPRPNRMGASPRRWRAWGSRALAPPLPATCAAGMRSGGRVARADFADAYPRQLSGGMKRRVSLARALVTDPDILLMDEPFAALDEITRFRLNNDLLALWRKLNKTVVFVTHSVFESVYLSQRVVVMTQRPGRISSEFHIDAPEPRAEDFRTSAEYAGYCRQVSNALAPSYGGTAGR